MQRLVSCLIENCPHYKDQPVNDGRGISLLVVIIMRNT